MLTIFDRFKKVLKALINIDPDTITLEQRLDEDLKLDSLDRIELVMDVEEEFKIEICDEDALKILTVSDYITYLTNRLAPPMYLRRLKSLKGISRTHRDRNVMCG